MPACFRRPLTAALIVFAASPALAVAAPGSGTLMIEVGNVRNSRGLIHVDVCTQAQFLKEDCSHSGEVPAHLGVTQITIHGVAAGQFAVQATHDENGNRKVDRGLFGVPTEGIGFSRGARIRFGPPKWADAMMQFDGHYGRTTVNLRYFTGPSGPATH